MLVSSLKRSFSLLHYCSPFLLFWFLLLLEVIYSYVEIQSWEQQRRGHEALVFLGLGHFIHNIFYFHNLPENFTFSQKTQKTIYPMTQMFHSSVYVWRTDTCSTVPIVTLFTIEALICLGMSFNWWMENVVHTHDGISFLLFKLLRQKLDNKEGRDWNYSQGTEMLGF